MNKEPRILKLPIVERDGVLEQIIVDDIISMEVPTDTTLVSDMTGEVINIDANTHSLIYVKTYKKDGYREFHIPLSLKEMIYLVNSDAAYNS